MEYLDPAFNLSARHPAVIVDMLRNNYHIQAGLLVL
jgi:hypothetical protein